MPRPRPSIGNPPAEATSFVGRRNELAEITRKLTAGRVVSLVGPGGVGKTRLAIRAATTIGRRFRDGAWFVDLAEVDDPDLVPNSVMAALGLRDQSASEPASLVLSYLRQQELLLVLDNCEHVIDAVARLVMDVVTTSPGVRVIVTSREPISVPPEHVVAVPTLDLPSASESVAQLRRNDAVTLFVERAGAASSGFDLTDPNHAAVAELCRRLDGLPLAIEMAAVRTRTLTVEQILARLTDRFEVLTGGLRAALPRHQTLATTIDWSYDLLSPHERRQIRCLHVFAGNFTLEDAEAISATPNEVPAPPALDLLSSLVDKSLVMRKEVRGVVCYRLHETMRAYTGIKLREAGDLASVEVRFVQHYAATCRRSEAEASSARRKWLKWIDVEIDNVRAALQRCVSEGQPLTGLDIACDLRWYWMTRANSEGARWLDTLLAAGPQSAAVESRARFIRAYLATVKGDVATAKPQIDLAVAAAREAGEATLLCQSLAVASVVEKIRGDPDSAARLLEEVSTLASRLDNPDATLAFLQARSLNALFDGRLDEVGAAAAEGVRVSRESGDLHVLMNWLVNLGSAQVIKGEVENAKPTLLEGLRVACEIDDRTGMSFFVEALACHAASTRQQRFAAQLFGAAEALHSETGGRTMPLLTGVIAQAKESAMTMLGASKFEAELNAGRQMGLESAILLALGQTSKVSVTHTDEAAFGPLGKREAEVAELVADGLSNKQIAARLFISRHTVDSHIRSIMNKLGCSSRAQIAAWVASSNAIPGRR